MKRKKLLEFADYLERSRKRFDVTNAQHCISMQACRFNGDVKGSVIHAKDDRPRIGSAHYDLVRIFDMPKPQAVTLYQDFNWGHARRITRKVAASVVRRLAVTGKVDWGEFAEKHETLLIT